MNEKKVLDHIVLQDDTLFVLTSLGKRLKGKESTELMKQKLTAEEYQRWQEIEENSRKTKKMLRPDVDYVLKLLLKCGLIRIAGEREMSYHKDREVNSAIIHLLDALCQWERETGRRSLLLLIPENPDEPIVLGQDGKPLPDTSDEFLGRMLAITLMNRWGKSKK